MIRNFTHTDALITFDSRLNEIRIVKQQEAREIKFIKISNTESEFSEVRTKLYKAIFT